MGADAFSHQATVRKREDRKLGRWLQEAAQGKVLSFVDLNSGRKARAMLGLANMPPFPAQTVKARPFLLCQHTFGFAAVTRSPLTRRLRTSKVSFPFTLEVHCGFMGLRIGPPVT